MPRTTLNPLRDMVILKNVAVTKMPLAIVAKNHKLTTSQIIHKARHTAELVALIASDSSTVAGERFHLSADHLDAIIDYHAAHASQKGGV